MILNLVLAVAVVGGAILLAILLTVWIQPRVGNAPGEGLNGTDSGFGAESGPYIDSDHV